MGLSAEFHFSIQTSESTVYAYARGINGLTV